jgi:hypothetical protein
MFLLGRRQESASGKIQSGQKSHCGKVARSFLIRELRGGVLRSIFFKNLRTQARKLDLIGGPTSNHPDSKASEYDSLVLCVVRRGSGLEDLLEFIQTRLQTC